MQKTKKLLLGALLGTVLVAPSVAFADPPDVRARVHVGPVNRPHPGVRVDRFHRVPPGVRFRGRPGRLTVRVNPFRARVGWRVSRFTPRERYVWTHGRWWHGRHNGRLGWWWWVDGGWFFYNTPVYPYPGYVSDTYYEDATDDAGNYWYYCRNPRGYYPYVQTCRGDWEPVPAQPSDMSGYGDQYGPDDQMAPDNQGPDSYDPGDQGPPDSYGPDDQGPPDGYGPDDQGPPDDYGPPDQGPPPQ